MPKAISVTGAIVFALASYVYSEEAPSISLEELKAKADAIMKLDNVSARRDIDIVFTLVDRLLDGKQGEEAEMYLVRGLQVFPWNLKYQTRYAEMLDGQGKHEQAQDKAALVINYGETDELIERAGIILKKAPIGGFAEISALPGTGHCVVLVPLQGCDRWLIAHTRDELSSTLGIPVFIHAVTMKYPPASRDRRQSIINMIRKQIIKRMNDIQVVAGMKILGLTKEDLNKETNALKLIRQLLQSSSPDTIAQFEAKLADSIGKDPQWNADQLQTTLSRAVDHYRRKNIAYLGITPVDIYAEDFNYLFGWAKSSCGIMSYRRFTADFNAENPNQERLVKRTLMQCLSSVGIIYGLERCTDPTCARAYPNSLEEHDAKTGQLCAECRNGFQTIFEQDKSSMRGKPRQ